MTFEEARKERPLDRVVCVDIDITEQLAFLGIFNDHTWGWDWEKDEQHELRKAIWNYSCEFEEV